MKGKKCFYISTLVLLIKDKAEFYLKDFLRQVFTKFVFEPTNSGIILYTLSAMKLFTNDGRMIALKVLSTFFKMSYFQTKNNSSIFTEESTSIIGKFAPASSVISSVISSVLKAHFWFANNAL